MTTLLKSIHKFEDTFYHRAELFAFRHPFHASLAMSIGMPIFVIAALAVCTTAITLPVAMIFGWL